jgi:hypothetical protein
MRRHLDFPLVHPHQAPNDDLAHAISLLRIAGNTLLNVDRLDEQGTKDMFVVVDEVIQRLRPLHRYLDTLDYRGMCADYAKARREVIAGVQEDGQ